MTLVEVVCIIVLSIACILFGLIAAVFVISCGNLIKKKDNCVTYYFMLRELNNIKSDEPTENFSISTEKREIILIKIISNPKLYCFESVLQPTSRRSKIYNCVSCFNNGYALAYSTGGWRLLNTCFEESFNKNDIAKFCEGKEFEIKDGMLLEK